MDENGRPARIAGPNDLILKLIEINETMAQGLSDEQLEKLREVARQDCIRAWPKIEEARNAYQYPSQAFYVFDRILNRRRLNLAIQAEVDRAVD